MDTFGSVLEGHEDASVGINKSSIEVCVALRGIEVKNQPSFSLCDQPNRCKASTAANVEQNRVFKLVRM